MCAPICNGFTARTPSGKGLTCGVSFPAIRALVSAHPERTFFTRFIPARRPEERTGAWRRYYERWAGVTIEKIGPEMVALLPQLAAFVPPAAVIDKRVYSPWHWPELDIRLRERSVDTIIVTGIRVLSTVLGAIDRGYRVVVATDALCSSSEETHDALRGAPEKPL